MILLAGYAMHDMCAQFDAATFMSRTFWSTAAFQRSYGHNGEKLTAFTFLTAEVTAFWG